MIISISKLRSSALCLIVAAVLSSGMALSQGSPPARPAVVLIGPPLSGKTTFVTRIQDNYRIPGISVEDLIRDNAAELRRMHPKGTSLADTRYDPAMSRYLRTRLNGMDLSRGVALDGFPATRHQAEDLAKMSAELALSPIVLQLEIPDEIVRQRAAQGGRQSDSPKIIEQRIKDYHREFDMISAYFPNAKVVKIDGTQSEDNVWKVMQQALDQAKVGPATK
jgi:adenylate kinase family enzyme